MLRRVREVYLEKRSTMADLIVELGPDIKVLRKSLPASEFRLILLLIFKRVVQCHAHYLLVFLQNPLEKVPQNLDHLIHEDLKSMTEFFAFRGKTVSCCFIT